MPSDALFSSTVRGPISLAHHQSDQSALIWPRRDPFGNGVHCTVVLLFIFRLGSRLLTVQLCVCVYTYSVLSNSLAPSAGYYIYCVCVYGLGVGGGGGRAQIGQLGQLGLCGSVLVANS